MSRNTRNRGVVTVNSGQFTRSQAYSRLPIDLRKDFDEYFEKGGHNGYDQMYSIKKIPPKK